MTLGASRDNTLFEEDGGLSDGAGQYVFAGTNNIGGARRAVLQFDLAAAGVPGNATVDSVHLTLTMSRTQAETARAVSLHRVLESWGEGASTAQAGEGMGGPAQPDDATWTHRFFGGELWTTAGGSFALTPSASLQVGELSTYAWRSTPAMVADAQSWIENPEQNFGWILIGQEDAPHTAKRFDSRSNSASAGRPSLRVFYKVP